jgi:hypothetical protein
MSPVPRMCQDQHGRALTGRCTMGDKGGKKDKDKGKKQKASKQHKEEKKKLDKQPKRSI